MTIYPVSDRCYVNQSSTTFKVIQTGTISVCFIRGCVFLRVGLDRLHFSTLDTFKSNLCKYICCWRTDETLIYRPIPPQKKTKNKNKKQTKQNKNKNSLHLSTRNTNACDVFVLFYSY